MMKKKTNKKILSAYKTYALSDDYKTDEKSKVTSPSEEDAKRMRDWSMENKL